MNAPFPVPGALAAVISEPAEKAMDIVQKVAAAIRSLRSSYLKGALEKHPPQIFVVSRKADVSAIVGSQQETICALAKSSKTPPPASVELVPKGCEPPKGCASDLIDSDLEVHILLKGVVDMSKEVTRLQKELGQVQGRFDKLKKKMDAPDYASKCPASQQAEDATKLHDTEAEITTLNGLIANFQANVD
uniref:valine--tRNA ligase n=1 Tax=Prymnesium polylepis TaxID=72548 RepID=A0A7S4IHR2_9EUKA